MRQRFLIAAQLAIAFAQRPALLAPGLVALGGDMHCQLQPIHVGRFGEGLLRLGEVGFAFGIEDDGAILCALGADVARQRPRIDAGNAGDALHLQPLIEVVRSAEVRGVGDILAQDEAGNAGLLGFDIFHIGADIADMREGEGDDLPGIARVGEDFLIAGHRRVEADFPGGDALGADAMAGKHRPIRKNQCGVGRGDQRRSHKANLRINAGLLRGGGAAVKGQCD